MDPVSLCASILAIVAGAQSALQGLRKIKQYWGAPKQIDKLATEIESLQCLLHRVSAFVESSDSCPYSEDLSQPVERAGSIVESFTNLVLSPQSRDAHACNIKGARLTWLRHKNDILELFDQLKIVKSDLSVRLALCSASSSTRAEQSLSISIAIQDKISQQLSIIIERNSDADNTDIWRSINSISKGLVDDENDSASVDSERPTRAFANFSAIADQLPPTRDDGQARLDSSRRLSRQPARRCAPWCSCKCHVKRSFRSPWVLEMVFGQINVQYAGQRPKCNEKKCHRSSPVPLSITCQLPQYLFKRYIRLTMHYTPLDGPSFSLRAPRVTPSSHRYWHYASKGDLQAIQKMFSHGQASPYDINPRGANALLFLGFHGNLEFTQFLIEQGADPNLSDNEGEVPSEQLWDYSLAGVYGGDGPSAVGCMLKDIDDMEARRLSNVHRIVLKITLHNLRSELESSTACIDLGDARNRTPLWWAAARDDFETVKTLLSFDTDPNITDDAGRSPLYFARSVAVCRALLSAGARVTTRSLVYQRTALHSMCHYERPVEVVDLLVNAGVPIEARDADEETPLLSAIRWGKTATAKRLVELGADVNAVDVHRRNSLHLATIHNRFEIIPLLLAKDADHTALTAEGRNIAHFAAQAANSETILTLAESNLEGLDVLLKDNDSKTPVDYLDERDTFGVDEAGVYEAFDEFMRFVSLQGAYEFSCC